MGKQIPLKRVFPPEVKSHFVSNIVVQHQSDAFFISFYEIWPPVILGDTEEERNKELEQIESVEAKCVSKIIVSPEKMVEFINVLQENLSKYEQKAKK